MGSLSIYCSYCSYQSETYNAILQHQQSIHCDEPIKIKYYESCPLTGNLDPVSKLYNIVPSALRSNQSIVFYADTNKVGIMTKKDADSAVSSPSLKRRNVDKDCRASTIPLENEQETISQLYKIHLS